MPPLITSVENAPYQDGLNLQVTLSGPPVGDLAFYANPRPGSPAQTGANLKPHEVLGGNVYRVQVRTGDEDQPARSHRMPFNVIAVDGTGASEPEGEWLCHGLNTGWLNQVDELLQSHLVANIGLLDRAMNLELGATEWANGRAVEVQKIHRGEPGNEEGNKFPKICHQAHSINEDYLGGTSLEAGLPYSDFVPITGKVECYALYQAGVEWGFVVKALGMGVWNILNQPHYRENDLACGLRMFNCGVQNGSLSEYFDASLDAWIVAFTMTWSGLLHASKYHPDLY